MPSCLATIAFESPASTWARMNLASSSGVSAVALLVLGDLGVAIGRQVAHDDRNLAKPGSDRCAQPLRAEVDAVPAMAIGRMHDEWLQDTTLLEVRGEVGKRVLGELGARVVRILVEHRHRHEHGPTVVDAGLGAAGEVATEAGSIATGRGAGTAD